MIFAVTPDAPSHFEGDIVLTDGQRAELEAETGKPFNLTEPQRAVTRNENGLWPDGKVPYYISSRLGKSAILYVVAIICVRPGGEILCCMHTMPNACRQQSEKCN